MKILRRIQLTTEVVLWEAFTKSCLAAVLYWPLVHLTGGRQGLVVGMYTTAAAIVVRSKVTPNVRVDEKIEAAVKDKEIEIHDFLAGATKPLRRKS